MAQISPQLIEAITKEVIKALGEFPRAQEPTVCTGQIPVLVLGELQPLGAKLLEKYRLYQQEDYARDGDIHKYQGVIITGLTNAQLSDVALARDSRPFSCAVGKALLCGIPVYLLESALTYWQYKQTANKRFYQVLEGYVQRLREFDIKIGSLAEIENWLSCRPASPKASSAAKGPSKVLCAREVQELINGAVDGKIKLPGGTMITPLARDMLRGYEIEFI